MFDFLSNKGNEPVVCSNSDCKDRKFRARDLLFMCPGGTTCPGYHEDDTADYRTYRPDDVLFRPRRYAYQVLCPHGCGNIAHFKVCPHCYERQPVSTGRSATIAIIGTSLSGKTCFITGLIRHIKKELSKRERYCMSLEWLDQDSLKYFQEREQEIFRDGVLPRSQLARETIKSLDITVKFRTLGWRRWVGCPQAQVSLMFPDPSGELFENLDDMYYVHYLARARAVILMIDPFSAERYQKQRELQGEDMSASKFLMSPATALGAFLNNVHGVTGRTNRTLNQELALVVTKCDEKDVFNPDDGRNVHLYPPQARRYSGSLQQALSLRVQQEMELNLELHDVVALATQNFRHVGYFAASALGVTPIRMPNGDVKVVDPKPRRVEDALLWVLHRWGYL